MGFRMSVHRLVERCLLSSLLPLQIIRSESRVLFPIKKNQLAVPLTKMMTITTADAGAVAVSGVDEAAAGRRKYVGVDQVIAKSAEIVVYRL